MNLRISSTGALTALAASAFAATTSAQAFNNQWVEFVKADNQPDLGAASNIDTETDLAWADLDKDGDTDLVVVRKEPFTSAGRRTNLLFMNEGGVLTNRTDEYASASDVLDDEGFNTETNDRDVVVGDVDLDGWLDIITATTLSDGEPKHIGHPRVYMNLGEDGSGNWLGFEHQDARIPQFIQYSTGQPQNPRFCSVAVGDVTGDGYPDLYFGDYDSSGAGGEGQPPGLDLNDRLLINDGTGHFSDESQSRMTSDMLLSAFGNSVEIADFNMDGANDILKDTALNFPQRVSVSYNNLANEGTFNIFDPFHTFAPYHTSCGDLNNDGRLDLVVSDDGNDRVRYNLDVDPLGRVIWSDALTFDFVSGSDDGFGSNNLIADLDGDGWNDALIADVDVDIGGYNRRLHIYHNPGGEVGEEIRLIEERQQNSGGWLGAVGLESNDLKGTHDIAVFDADGDLDNDLVISNFRATTLWSNQANICQIDEGGSSGGANLKVCGKGLASGEKSTVLVSQAPAGETVLFLYGTTQSAIPFAGGTLVAVPSLGFSFAATDAAGEFSIELAGGAGPADIYLQAIVTDASSPFGFQITQAVKLELEP